MKSQDDTEYNYNPDYQLDPFVKSNHDMQHLPLTRYVLGMYSVPGLYFIPIKIHNSHYQCESHYEHDTQPSRTKPLHLTPNPL